MDVDPLAGAKRKREDEPAGDGERPLLAALLVAGGVLLIGPWCVVAAAWCGGLARRRLKSGRGSWR